MFSTLSRSWSLTKRSFSVIDKDKEMLLFALIGGLLSIGWIVGMVWPFMAVTVEQGGGVDEVEMSALEWVRLGHIRQGLGERGTRMSPLDEVERGWCGSSGGCVER